VDPESVERLATSLAVCVCLFGLLAAFGFSRYGLTREKHVEILQSLAARRLAVSETT
jgi:Na+/melibiose symporter-like transporter